MIKAYLNPQTNIVDDPKVPCYKAPERGLCKMRADSESKFECANDPAWCRYLKYLEGQWKPQVTITVEEREALKPTKEGNNGEEG